MECFLLYVVSCHLYIVTISFLEMFCSNYIFPLNSVLVGCYVSRKLSISFQLSYLLAYNCSYIVLWFLSISAVFIEISPFSFLSLSSSSVVGESGQRFVNFILSKNHHLFNDFFCFLNLYYIDSLSDLYDFRHSADFRFCLFFFF